MDGGMENNHTKGVQSTTYSRENLWPKDLDHLPFRRCKFTHWCGYHFTFFLRMQIKDTHVSFIPIFRNFSQNFKLFSN